MFHFRGENLWLTVAYLASMQFPKSNGFDKGKLGFTALLNNLLDSYNNLLANDDLVNFVKKMWLIA